MTYWVDGVGHCSADSLDHAQGAVTCEHNSGGNNSRQLQSRNGCDDLRVNNGRYAGRGHNSVELYSCGNVWQLLVTGLRHGDARGQGLHLSRH